MILNTAAAAHLSTFAPLVDKVMLQEMRDLIAQEELLAMASTLLVGPASDLEILGGLLRPPAHGDVAGQAHKLKGGGVHAGLAWPGFILSPLGAGDQVRYANGESQRTPSNHG